VRRRSAKGSDSLSRHAGDPAYIGIVPIMSAA
jgi:hypothetical protein